MSPVEYLVRVMPTLRASGAALRRLTGLFEWAKFSQHDELRAMLLGTGDAVLIEHTTKDNYWGDGGDGSGKNRLGQILMSVREELRRQEETE